MPPPNNIRRVPGRSSRHEGAWYHFDDSRGLLAAAPALNGPPDDVGTTSGPA
jgi:hypothetical protein